MSSLHRAIKSNNKNLADIVSVSFLAAYISLAVGVFAPVVQMSKKLVVFKFSFELSKDTYSLIEAIIELFRNGNLVLSVIIFIFSILFPLSKIIALNYIWNREITPESRKTVLNIISAISKWSMLDVFVIASVIVIAKLSSVADAEARWGIYVFGIHVLISMLLSLKLTKINNDTKFSIAGEETN
jgi:paraquat-inducible protein A